MRFRSIQTDRSISVLSGRGKIHMPHMHIRNALSASIALVLTAAVPSSAFAQEAAAAADTPSAQATAAAPDQATSLDAVVVTGYRYAIEKSLDQKRNANAIVEVVTAEDVGK